MTFLRIVVDTCVWIDFIAQGNDALATYLRRGRILLHPMVMGEVALGSLSKRTAVLEQHDIASARLVDGGRVRTRDKRLAEQAGRLAIAFFL